MMNFTVPEINLIYIYLGATRNETINNITEGIPHITDPDMLWLAESTLGKLTKLSDEEFTLRDFEVEYTKAED